MTAIARGFNGGHIAPYCDINYREAIARAKRAGTWKSPVFSVPLPDLDRDERIKSLTEREKSLAEQIKLDREVGILVDQDRVKHLASVREVEEPTLVAAKETVGEIFQYHITEKMVAPDEVRDRLGLEPLPGGIGTKEQLAREREEGRDKTGTVRQTDEVDEKAPAQPAEEQAA